MKHFLPSFGLAALLFAVTTPVHGQTTPTVLPKGDGAALLATACSQCHGLSTITAMRDGAAGWHTHVSNMVLRGAQLTAPEIETLVQYLATNFGPGTPPAASATKATPVVLPDGPGKELVETRCAACHDLERVVSVKRGKEEWHVIVASMVARGAPATPEEAQEITAYLTEKLGEK
jgi:mono/diheme cytochrome c family protein